MEPVPLFATWFGLGDFEILLILVVVLIFFGGSRMPEFARGLGKALRELRKATGEVEREFKKVMDEAENQTIAPFKHVMNPPDESRPAATPFIPPPAVSGPEPAPGSPEGLPSSAEDYHPVAPAPLPPPGPSTHRFKGGPDQDFHSDI